MGVSTVVVVVVQPLVYFAFLFFNETVITKTQGLVVAIVVSLGLLIDNK